MKTRLLFSPETDKEPKSLEKHKKKKKTKDKKRKRDDGSAQQKHTETSTVGAAKSLSTKKEKKTKNQSKIELKKHQVSQLRTSISSAHVISSSSDEEAVTSTTDVNRVRMENLLKTLYFRHVCLTYLLSKVMPWYTVRHCIM